MSEYYGALEEQLGRFGSNPHRGITAQQARESFSAFEGSTPEHPCGKSLSARFAAQFKNPMILALTAATILAIVLAVRGGSGGLAQPMFILILLCLGSALTVAHQARAAKVLGILREAYAPKAQVVRDGGMLSLSGEELVPGDIVVVKAGDFALADGRLVESAGLICDESPLTGQKTPAHKDHAAQLPEDTPLGERANMLYAGCAVVSGQGRYLVTATGSQTEISKFTLADRPTEDDTHIQSGLGRAGSHLGLIGLCASGAVFIAGLVWGGEFVPTLLAALALGVVLLPGAVTGLVRYSLALTARRLNKSGTSVLNLSALETLGSVSVICTEKTGTLTVGRMKVHKLWAASGGAETFSADIGRHSLDLLRLAALCCDGRVELRGNELRHIGQPAQTAILAGAFKHGMPGDELEVLYPRVASLPFDPRCGLKTTVHQVEDKLLSITQGELDALLPRCRSENKNAAKIHENMCSLALSVVAVACRELERLPDEITSESLEQNLTFMGLVGIYDPPREESEQAAYLCRKAGIRTVMLSSEHPLTARAIAEELDMLREGEYVLSGERLDEIGDDELPGEIGEYSVYSRLGEQDIARVFDAWRAKGKTVLLTGSVPQDAPILEAAEIGCALPHATDLAKSAADIVVNTDGFEAIVRAVGEARNTLANTNNLIAFLLGCGLAQAITMLVSAALGWGVPLVPSQLLLLSLVACAFQAVEIGAQSQGDEPMKHNVPTQSENILAGGPGRAILLQGVVLSAAALAGCYLGAHTELSRYLPPSGEMGITMAFLVLFLGQLGCTISFRRGDGLLTSGIAGVKPMLRAIAGSLSVLVLIVATPLSGLLGLSPLSMIHWVWVVMLGLATLFVGEVVRAAVSVKEGVL
ncbi:MAG: cation-translocating P-type ATPase [Oscillospiraceae bacterium]|nr:cation-translocating P-type ATPase [Oscillospiraceae bacterium]